MVMGIGLKAQLISWCGEKKEGPKLEAAGGGGRNWGNVGVGIRWSSTRGEAALLGEVGCWRPPIPSCSHSVSSLELDSSLTLSVFIADSSSAIPTLITRSDPMLESP